MSAPREGSQRRFVLAVHGGAGNPAEQLLRPERLARCEAGIVAALRAGATVLDGGGSAVDAVIAAVVTLEDDEEFNAARGAVPTSAGTVETDAAVMDGAGRRVGAVGALTGIRNPVLAARAVLDHSPHNLLVGPAAAVFARFRGCSEAPADYFVTDRRWSDWQRAEASAGDAGGTVGAVALDGHGHLAAATSTGGIFRKAPGRVGDTPIPGSGTWADDATCAISATGSGEALMRAVFSHRVHGLVSDGIGLDDACRLALDEVVALGGRGGCVAVDRLGRVSMPCTTTVMYRGSIDERMSPHAAVLA
jgi:L-asparaginase / beta-aspartyl-peptidase